MQEVATTTDGIREAWWWEAEKKRSTRLNYLRKAVWSKGATGGRYQEGVTGGTDRIYWWTKVYKQTDRLPEVERRASALETYLTYLPIFIIDQSQIVGYISARPNEVPFYPEGSVVWNEDFYYDPQQMYPEEDKSWIRECLNYWNERCFQTLAERHMSQEEIAATLQGPVAGGMNVDMSSSAVFDYDFTFENGLDGITGMIDTKINAAEGLLSTGPATPDTLHLIDKVDEWRAMKLAVGGVIQWSKRYSRLARIVAENFETDAKRMAELLKISEICAKVPARPAEHLHEAIQCERFVGLAARLIERLSPGWAERIDQIYWPYYKKDVLDEKSLTREEAIELLAENNIRMYEACPWSAYLYRIGTQGSPIVFPTVTIGGVDEDGRDACNDLTDAILEATRLVRVSEPSFQFRYHPGARISTLREVFENIRQGMGHPAIQHDAINQEVLMSNYGATLQEARSYAHVVCMSPGVTKGRGGQGVRYACCQALGVWPLELALYDGFEPCVLRLQMGPHTGDPSKFERFEEFIEAYREQVANQYQCACRCRNKHRYLEAKYLPSPFGSSLFKRCVESGIDMTDARSEPLSNAWITQYTGAEVIDSLYAIKRLVFEEKKYTMNELLEALKANWVGYAEMRQDFVNLPKFGNDVDEVDEMARLYYRIISEECGRNIEWGGGRFMPLPQNLSAFSAFAPMLGALPNGRRLGDCLYDGGISPGAGFDKKGPTAVLRSVSKVDGRRLKQVLLNQRLSPTQLAGDKGFQLWMNYMQTWYDLNIPHVQFNMVDNETLRAAQREPEKYQELIVRVAGYSAHFVELNALTQEGIIERTVQEI
ncbi:MAG: pyruvate formate lyase family protein [Chloroflexota bacterium]|nr:pyruvate formate lyase family protein [Chloroflexota bacterium]